MRQSGQHAMDTGHAFLAAIKAARADYQEQHSELYKKFVGGKDTPTAHDVELADALIQEMETLANVWHNEVSKAALGFGGIQDSDISNMKVLRGTIAMKLKKAAAQSE